jgi:hypothetical protein
MWGFPWHRRCHSLGAQTERRGFAGPVRPLLAAEAHRPLFKNDSTLSSRYSSSYLEWVQERVGRPANPAIRV